MPQNPQPLRILALDISSKTGFVHALVDKTQEEPITLCHMGRIELPDPILQYGRYPFCYARAAKLMASMLMEQTTYKGLSPHVIVIEETNLGRSRYSQKWLEFVHSSFLAALDHVRADNGPVVAYVSSGSWRKAIGLVLTKEDKKNNALLSKAKRAAHQKNSKVDKGGLGIAGKVTAKHLAVRYANKRFGLELKMKDNDVADAIGLACGYVADAPLCDGI